MPAEKTKYQGVIYRESKTRKFKGRNDRCYYIRYYVGSTQREEKIGWTSEGYSPEAAHAIRNERLHLRRNHTVIKKNVMTFRDAAKLYFEWAKSHKKTWKDDEYRYNMHISKEFDSYPLNTIKPSDIIAFIQKLKSIKNKVGDDYKLQTILHYIKVIRQVFTFVIDTDIFDGQNPALQKKVKLAKFDSSRQMYLYDNEIKSLLKACDDSTDIWIYDRVLIKFALFSGFRKREIFAMTWDRLDIHKKLYYLSDVKGKVNQYISLSDAAINELKRLDKIEGEPYIFPSRRGGKRWENRAAWLKLKQRAGLRDNLVFHDLRHTFGTLAASAGVPVEIIQKMMTHKDIETTLRYAHIVNKRLKAGADAFDNILFEISQNNEVLS